MITKNAKKMQILTLQSIMVISAITISSLMLVGVPNADAYLCTSQHSGSKCYATHQYDVTSDFHGLKATSEVQYTDGTDGAVTFSHWIDLSNADIVEVA